MDEGNKMHVYIVTEVRKKSENVYKIEPGLKKFLVRATNDGNAIGKVMHLNHTEKDLGEPFLAEGTTLLAEPLEWESDIVEL